MLNPEEIYSTILKAGERKARRAAYCREWRKRNPEKQKQLNKAWHAKNGKRINAERREIKRRWHLQNRARILLQKADYRKKNREHIYAACAERRAVKRGSGGKYTKEQIRVLYAVQKGRCVYCKTSLEGGFHRDHVMPLILGGKNEISNIQLLCVSCNLQKNKLHPVEFARRMGLLL